MHWILRGYQRKGSSAETTLHIWFVNTFEKHLLFTVFTVNKLYWHCFGCNVIKVFFFFNIILLPGIIHFRHQTSLKGSDVWWICHSENLRIWMWTLTPSGRANGPSEGADRFLFCLSFQQPSILPVALFCFPLCKAVLPASRREMKEE